MYYLGTLMVAGGLMIVGNYLTRYVKVLDKPGKDVPKRKRVPTVQGITMIISFFILLGLFYSQYLTFSPTNPFLGLLLGGLLIAVISFIDELGLIRHKKYALSSGVRLFGHIAAALLAYGVSGVGITEFQLPGDYLLTFGPLSTFVFTIGWYLLFINAINRFDGVYGLASGVSSVGFLTIFLLLSLVVFVAYPEMTIERFNLLQGVQGFAWILFVLSFCSLVMERKPWGLLRDVGTMFFGFSLAYLALLGGTKIGMMLVVLALPLFDAIFVVVDRLHRRKKHPFKGDFSHLQYRLLALGRNRNEIRVFVLLVSLFLVLLMLLLGDDRIGKMIIFVVMAGVYFGVNVYLYWVKGLDVEYKPLKRDKK